MKRRPKILAVDDTPENLKLLDAILTTRGYELATAAIPVVALTASVMKEDRERFDKAGFDGFITKPISVKEFPDQVRSYMRGRT